MIGFNQDTALACTQGHDVRASPTRDAMGDRVYAACGETGLHSGDKLGVDKMVKRRLNVDKLVHR